MDSIYRLMTQEQVAEELSMSVSHVKQLMAEGQLPVWKPSAQTVRVPYWVLVYRISEANGVDLNHGLRQH